VQILGPEDSQRQGVLHVVDVEMAPESVLVPK
jgi:hypothetical protein